MFNYDIHNFSYDFEICDCAIWSLCYDIMLSHLTILLLQCANLSLYLGVWLLYFAILPLHSSVLQFRHWEKFCCCDLSLS